MDFSKAHLIDKKTKIHKGTVTLPRTQESLFQQSPYYYGYIGVSHEYRMNIMFFFFIHMLSSCLSLKCQILFNLK